MFSVVGLSPTDGICEANLGVRRRCLRDVITMLFELLFVSDIAKFGFALTQIQQMELAYCR